MTRKHFRQLAHAIKNTSNKEHLVDELCVILKQVNPRFNQTMFKDACK